MSACRFAAVSTEEADCDDCEETAGYEAREEAY